jgi:hypothetical protein
MPARVSSNGKSGSLAPALFSNAALWGLAALANLLSGERGGGACTNSRWLHVFSTRCENPRNLELLTKFGGERLA